MIEANTGPLCVRVDEPRSEAVARAHDHLAGGGLLIYPTETVYGLGGAPDPAGIEAVRRLKGREGDKPFLLLIPERLPRELTWGPAALALAGSFWPGPLTLVLPDPEGAFPPGVRSEEGGVAVRRSPHPFVSELLGLWKRPLLSTSANLPGRAAPSSSDEAVSAFAGRPGADRLLVADAGELPPAPPSSLVDLTGPRPRLLREGAVSRDQLLSVLPALR